MFRIEHCLFTSFDKLETYETKGETLFLIEAIKINKKIKARYKIQNKSEILYLAYKSINN